MSTTLEKLIVAASGDKCPRRGCKGRLQVIRTEVHDTHRMRFIGCRECGYRPVKNKLIVPIQYAPRRFRPPDIDVYDA